MLARGLVLERASCGDSLDVSDEGSLRRERGERDDRLVGVNKDEWDVDPRWRFQR